jgi:hypothetical protein
MQNNYVGDGGDFGKYLLLKKLAQNEVQVGINWCFVEPQKVAINNDGKFIEYLKDRATVLSQIDDDLFQKLKTIVDTKNRNIRAVNTDILPIIHIKSHFDEPIPLGEEREKWHTKSLSQLDNCKIFFYDPDNGLEVSSVENKKGTSKLVKYVFFDEICKTYNDAHKSIVIYQHANRQCGVEQQIKDRIRQVADHLQITDTNIRSHRSSVGSSRFFLIIARDEHRGIIESNLSTIDNNKLLITNKILYPYS